jgi:hypothetical protein
MPKTLTELEQFDSEIVVPLGTELTRAAHLESIAQRFANRTRHLLTRAGLLAADQTWTGLNAFSKNLSVNLATLFAQPPNSTTAAIRITNPPSPENWILKMELDAASGAERVRIYAGRQGSSLGALAIVFNAEWIGSAWHQVNVNAKSIALIWRHGDVRLVGKPDHAADWASWPQNTITGFGSEFLTEVARVGRAFAEANIDADGGQANGYRYQTAITRWSPIPIGTLWGNVHYNSAGHVLRGPASGGENVIYIPLRIAPYNSFRQVRVRVIQLQGSDPDQFQLMRRTGNGPLQTVGSHETGGTLGAEGVVTLHGGGAETLQTDQHEWCYRWRVVSGALESINNRIVGAEIETVDRVLSNRVG